MNNKEKNLIVRAHSGLSGTIKVPVSKSYAHRILICSALADKPTTILGKLDGDDIYATMDCLVSIGARIEKISENETMIFPIKSLPSDNPVVDVRESGSTLRFFLPLIAALGLKVRVKGSGRIAKRPITDLLDTLTAKGACIDSLELPLKLSGSIIPGDYSIKGNISSQYITGLLLALPLLNGDSRLLIEGEIVSKNYVDITLEIMKTYGVEVKTTSHGYSISGNKRYTSPGIIKVEGDWSSACFFAAAAVLSGDITFIGLNKDSLQGDRIVMELLKKAGAVVEEVAIKNDNKGAELDSQIGIRFAKKELNGISFSAKHCPDIVPIMSIMLARAKGESVIADTERLRLKESDRLSAILEVLRAMGNEAINENESLIINGGELIGAELPSFNDHRMVMSEAIAIVGTSQENKIWGAEAVNKSYPEFFEEYKRLGGEVIEF